MSDYQQAADSILDDLVELVHDTGFSIRCAQQGAFTWRYKSFTRSTKEPLAARQGSPSRGGIQRIPQARLYHGTLFMAGGDQGRAVMNVSLTNGNRTPNGGIGFEDIIAVESERIRPN